MRKEIPNPRKWLKISCLIFAFIPFLCLFSFCGCVLMGFSREFYATPLFCNYFVVCVCVCVWFTTCIRYSVFSKSTSTFLRKKKNNFQTLASIFIFHLCSLSIFRGKKSHRFTLFVRYRKRVSEWALRCRRYNCDFYGSLYFSRNHSETLKKDGKE